MCPEQLGLLIPGKISQNQAQMKVFIIFHLDFYGVWLLDNKPQRKTQHSTSGN
jgi:hypothetical protein